MTTFLRNLPRWCVLAVLLFIPSAAHSQTGIDHTTFTAAVSATATDITLSAASGSSAGDYLYVDGELMRLTTAVNASTTNWNVRRGLGEGFTPARRHPASSIVWVMDSGTQEGPRQFNVEGACTAATERYLPHINTKENRIFDCGGSGYWLEREREIVSVQSALTICGGRLKCREEFNGGHGVMTDAGAVKGLTDADQNFVYGSPLGIIEYREEETKTASSWVTINGQLDISGDNTTTAEGVEIVFGATSDAALNQVVELGTNGACISAMITVTDISGIDNLFLGWRQNEAFQNFVHTGYDDWAVIGLQDTAGDLDIEDEEAGAGTQNDDTGITWADGERRALKTCLSSAGVPTFYYTAASPDNEEPLYIQATSTNTGDALTAGEGFIPFLSFLISGTDGPDVTIQYVQIEYTP